MSVVITDKELEAKTKLLQQKAVELNKLVEELTAANCKVEIENFTINTYSVGDHSVLMVKVYKRISGG